MKKHIYETRYQSLLPVRAPVDSVSTGTEFSMKIVALASNVPSPTSMRLNFGEREGKLYAEQPEADL